MDFNLNINAAAAQNAHTGGKIDTGLSLISIEENFIYKSKNGNNLMDLQVRDADGAVGFLNGLCLDEKWTSGSANFDYARNMELMVVLGFEGGQPVACKRKKYDAEEDAFTYPALKGKECKVLLYTELDVYNNKQKETLKLAGSFYLDGKTPAEKEKGLPAVQIVKDSDRLENFETKAYKAWSIAGKPGPEGTVDPTTPVEATTSTPTTNIFGA